MECMPPLIHDVGTFICRIIESLVPSVILLHLLKPIPSILDRILYLSVPKLYKSLRMVGDWNELGTNSRTKCLYLLRSTIAARLFSSYNTDSKGGGATRQVEAVNISLLNWVYNWVIPPVSISFFPQPTKTASEVFSAYSEEQKSYAAGSTFYPKGVALVAFGFCCLIYGQRTAVSVGSFY
ncbi:hypothetical protein BDP27DRAFT_1378039 [Rhodocollybia butyracea]|uniref:Uncharacterized protein n=1 Tax=Rhodocollybia butyracea TaxID=206335 RepID=A0A9P5P3D9_9AGAR|nr:hypothetical protein BDP27DRAFT_1378039 [Rhodocollybia butyracea]